MSTTDIVASRAGAESLLIGGRWQAADETYERFDPSRLTRLTGRFAAATEDHVRAAYVAAARAQPEWARTPAPQRAEVLRRAADLLTARAEEAARRLTADIGKVIRDARAEVARSVAILRYFAGELAQPTGETYASVDPDTLVLTVEQPLGVVCAITPWNFPFAIPTWKLAPALGFGNAVVWKPAEAASGSAVMLCEALAAAGMPDGVLNLVTGSGRALSSALTGDPRLNGITFTGSGPTGTLLRRTVADRNVKVQLELGGKNPSIVLGDADLADAARQVARAAMLATGQRCTATSRVLVEQSVLDEFSRLLAHEVEQLVVGDPHDEATDIGPVAFLQQRATVLEYLEVARAEGVTVISGQLAPPEDECFIRPVVITDVSRSSRLVREEIFGPVLIVEPVADLTAALAAANDTEFGLSAAVFTRDLLSAMRFIRHAEAGLVHVNRETAGVEPHVPFGGVKGSSSLNREQGKAARQFFTTTKTVYLRTPGANDG
jgi:aldehyde dehydrogenase (NAD+)